MFSLCSLIFACYSRPSIATRASLRLCNLACTAWPVAVWAFLNVPVIGTIPAELGQLRDLQQLSVWNNILSGETLVTRNLFLGAAIGHVETRNRCNLFWGSDVVERYLSAGRMWRVLSHSARLSSWSRYCSGILKDVNTAIAVALKTLLVFQA